MIDKYLQKIEQIGTIKILLIMIAYLFLMTSLSYAYRFIFTDRHFTSHNNLTQYLQNDTVSTLK